MATKNSVLWVGKLRREMEPQVLPFCGVAVAGIAASPHSLKQFRILLSYLFRKRQRRPLQTTLFHLTDNIVVQ